MISVYIMNDYDDEQLEAAMELMNAEHPESLRDTPSKMKELILSELGMNVKITRIQDTSNRISLLSFKKKS